jgi:hypothetical protein
VTKIPEWSSALDEVIEPAFRTLKSRANELLTILVISERAPFSRNEGEQKESSSTAIKSNH